MKAFFKRDQIISQKLSHAVSEIYSRLSEHEYSDSKEH